MSGEDKQSKLVDELKRRLQQQPPENTGGIQDLYKKSIKQIIEKIETGVYSLEDNSNQLKNDLQRVGFFDLANQVLRY